MSTLDIEKFIARNDIDSLIKTLKNADGHDRELAAIFLGNIREEQVVDVLIESLNDNDQYVKLESIRSLGKMGDIRAIPPLLDLLRKENQEDQVYVQIAWAFSDIGEKAVEPLLDVLTDSRRWVKRAAAAALGRIGDRRAVESLIGSLQDEDVNLVAATSLGEIGDKRAVGPLLAMLSSKDKYIWIVVSRALGEIRDSRAIDPLLQALKDVQKSVRKGAAEALGEIGDRKALEPLSIAIDEEPESDVRDIELRAYDEIMLATA